MLLDNYGISIMHMVNDLARRYGIRSCDFVATVETAAEGSHPVVLRYESHPEGRMAAPFDRMIRDLGISYVLELTGTEESVFVALDAAIERAPNRMQSR